MKTDGGLKFVMCERERPVQEEKEKREKCTHGLKMSPHRVLVKTCRLGDSGLKLTRELRDEREKVRE